MISAEPLRVAQFDWTAVDCFVRPQTVLCDEIADGYGRLFLFLLSLYRSWGIDGYFAVPEKQHFAFASAVIRERLDLEFRLTRLPDKDGQHQSLIDALSAGGRFLVPAQHRSDQAHYFIVIGHDAATNAYTLYDNLHVDCGNESRHYETRTISGPAFRSMVDLYWDTHVQGRRLTSHREPGTWFLQITAAPAFDAHRVADISTMMIGEYRRFLTECDDGCLHHVDDRNLRQLAEAVATDGADELRAPIRAYLAEANLALVHLTLLSNALEIVSDRPSSLAGEIEAYRRIAGELRAPLLVMCLAGSGRTVDWNAVRCQLVRHARDMKAAAAASLRYA